MTPITPAPTTRSRWSGIRLAAVELAVILLFGLLYNAAILAEDGLSLRGLDPNNRIEGVEHERLSGILIPIQIGLGLSERAPGIGHLPAWNPYLGTGTPLINDAFLYLFNPFMSLPVLLMGAVQGTKIAILIGMLLAGVNMWALAKALGLGRLSRVTTGILYMTSGGIIAKFFSGHFQLGLSLVWLPLVLAGLWWTLHTPYRWPPVLAALAFALMFFSGNIYYTLHALICCAVMMLVYLIGERPSFVPTLRRVAVMGVFALGLTMIQFLPVWAVRDYVSHEPVNFDSATGQIVSSYSLGQSLANLITPWDAWHELEGPPLGLLAAVDYAYIGPAPFLLIAGLALVGAGRRRRVALLALLLALGMMIWGAGQTFIVSELYRRVPLLSEFRYIGRANAVAALWWIVLAGIALDRLWRAIHERRFGDYDRARLLRVLTLALLLWGWFLYYSIANNSTRLALALNNLSLFNTLNAGRFVNYLQALDALLSLTAVLLIVDTLLMPIDLALLRRVERSQKALWPTLGARLLRVGLLLLALVAVADTLRVNRQLIDFGPPGNNFGILYATALGIGTDSNPFPSIQQPHSPATYDAYASRIRAWGLDEGWKPQPVPGDFIPEGAPWLPLLPQWAIVSTEYERGGTYELAQTFVEQHQAERVQCVINNQTAGSDDPCDITTNEGSILYRLPQALPYAFVIDEEALRTHADTLTSDTVRTVESVDHQLDTITLTATAVDDMTDYLIVQETRFPGWQAQIDGMPIEAVTVGAQTPGGGITGFIGVPMQPGRHVYRLHFDPPGFTSGAILSLLTLIAMGLYLSGLRFRRWV